MYYNGSLLQALRVVYPQHTWYGWLFARAPRDFWKSENNRKEFFDWYSATRGITDLSGWYKVSQADVCLAGGVALLSKYYDGTLSKALASIYNNHVWIAWKFDPVPRNCWSDPTNQREFLDDLARRAGLTQLVDWYDVQPKRLENDIRGLVSLLTLKYEGSLSQALQAVYPEHAWERNKFIRGDLSRILEAGAPIGARKEDTISTGP